MSLRTKMLSMSFLVVSISIFTSGLIMVYSISDAFEKELGERATAIARTVAQMPSIRENVGIPGGETIIQPFAERTRLATNVDYIVIIDMDRIRYSHPSESLIGKEFVGGDEKASLSEHEYVSKAKGTLGNSVRAFVPIMDEEGVVQVGVAVVGILTPTFQSLVAQYRNDIFLSLVWGLIIGLFGSLFLANNIKKQTFNLEPYEIARLAEERSAVMQAMDMGIIAVDEHGKITFMNRLAKEFVFNDSEKEITRNNSLIEFLPNLNEVITKILNMPHSQQIVNRSMNIYDKVYLVSLYPIYVKGQAAGSFITMVDKTEANRLAEELTGVKTLVDALRAQNHEYMNKLHSIAGLIQLERTEEALDIIIDETNDEENIIQFLKESITDYSVSGLLLGKRARARELGVQFHLDRQSYLHYLLDGFSAGDIITVLGNLIENSFEAYSPQEKNKIVECLLQGDRNHLLIVVRDNGKGIRDEDRNNIFTYGFSTKAKDGRGIGLALVKQIIEAQGGLVRLESEINKGTKITIEVERRGEK
ncbi:ATP-binding protein [Mesobacillus subterraneus]|uniref:histidine kinase n=1 Tax=Mesobacillus subterraneus TaxID=285983 RepID=A0A427TY66_9BACI|nr:sensor histidine kinase [Mesobacillus subterraneus]RSD29487.1 sensor histidine kinase [Mesobacillus subterraneus]